VSLQGGALVYEAGDWEVDLARRELRVRRVPVPIGGRAFEIIEVLVRSAGEVVSKHALMDRVWPGISVGENTLQVHISAVRKALGAERGMLRTASGRGYRLLGNWTVRRDGPVPAAAALEPARAPTQPAPTNLLAAASELIGRTAATQHVQDLLSAYRVVTLTGPGGIGKSALVLEVARNLLATLQTEVWLVELVSLSDPALVPSAVAAGLGIKLSGGEISPDSVAKAIGERKLLLVLDNCEHVIDAVAKLAETLLRTCPRTTILATSREILRIDGECVYRVPPLGVPPETPQESGEVLRHSAVQLFVARARALYSDFSPRDEDLAVIAAICRRLDGIPLAIEFAAARAVVLGLAQVAARLDDRFSLLTSGRRTALPRHQTLRATLEWSYRLLPAAEQRLLCHLAIFPAGFTLESAAAVTDAGNPAQAVVESIANLVSKSLVTLDGSAPADRWRLLETIRAYALQMLGESGERAIVAQRHAQYYMALLESANAEWQVLPASQWVQRHAHLVPNVRAALDWSFSPAGDDETGIALTVAAVPLWFQLSLVSECCERSRRALAASRPGRDPRQEMLLHAAIAWSLMQIKGSVPETQAAWATLLDMARTLGETDYRLRAIWGLWAARINAGAFRSALALAEEFGALAQAEGNQEDRSVGDRLVGYTLHLLGDQTGARRHIERMLMTYAPPVTGAQMIRFVFDQRAIALCFLARIQWLQGYPDQAMLTARGVVAADRASGDALSLCQTLVQAACPVGLLVGDMAAVAEFVAMLLDQSARSAWTFWHVWGQCFRGVLQIRRGELGAGLALLETALGDLRGIGFGVYYISFLGEFAIALGLAGQPKRGLVAIQQALARSDQNEERWCAPELLRTRGELLLLEAGEQPIAAAEGCFQEALAIARQQGALSWELRAATSLARLRAREHRDEDARQILAPVYARFTEGFETADLRAAQALLESLPPPATPRA
jgi:predicted ATPase/DNA-binding winged helix-turn-helix (wHTH) protein